MDFQDYLDIAKAEGRSQGLEEGRAEERANTEREKVRADNAEARLTEALARIAELEAK